MHCINIYKLLLLILTFCIVMPSDSNASEPLNPQLILGLKKGFMSSCLPTISRQLTSIGMPNIQHKSGLYCECLGNFYYNDVTKKEYVEIQKNSDRLPNRIIAKRRAIQEHCADTHLR